MSESQETPSEEDVPTPRDMSPIVVPDAPAPPREHLEEGPRDLTPISWGGVYDTDSDFRPKPFPSETSDPKDLSAAGSADFSEALVEIIPTDGDPMNPSPSDSRDKIASAEKDNSPSKAAAPSKPPSLPSPKTG